MNPTYYAPAPREERTLEADICVYGGTSAGIIAAVQSARLGKTAILVAPEIHLGGLSAGGLSQTDIGNKAAIGGLSHEFYRRVGQKYGVAEEWRFEPHVASVVFDEMLAEAKTPVFRGQFLASVEKRNGRLSALTTESGLTVRAKMFIDATYEGDLMARAGVSYHVGRESNATYGEQFNGAYVGDKHQFDLPISPYVVAGDAGSGLLPGIEDTVPHIGEGDARLQAYNFRLCVTQKPGNRLPFAKPAAYDAREYELLARYLQAGWPASEVFRKFDPLRGDKADKNNHGAVSTDFIGRNYAYPEASYAERERIFQAHLTYQQGLMWFMGHDPRVPAAIRQEWNKWGLCRDEFTATGGWSHQLYIREARRMKGAYIMTEADCRGQKAAPDSIGLAAYVLDSHNARRFVRAGRVLNEGDVQQGGFGPYPISYRALVPRAEECQNLLVPVCLSASHIAFGSIRMEPVFMITGQSAATAAALAIDAGVPVQDVSYAKLQSQLQKDGQILRWADKR